MKLHNAIMNRDMDLALKLIAAGQDVNEVEGAGNTPLHFAAYEGWCQGIEMLVTKGAKINASNNAGDSPWIWAANMCDNEAKDILEKLGADPSYRGRVIVPEHIPKVKDFYELPDGKEHPKPSLEFLEQKREEDRQRELQENYDWDVWSTPGTKNPAEASRV
jgi:ankyrin repeat protein